jgi:hypothetical protein
MHMTTLGTAVALLLVVTTSAPAWAGETKPAPTPAIVSAIESRDVSKATAATPRLAPDRERSMEADKRQRAMIIGLMMLMSPRHRR